MLPKRNLTVQLHAHKLWYLKKCRRRPQVGLHVFKDVDIHMVLDIAIDIITCQNLDADTCAIQRCVDIDR